MCEEFTKKQMEGAEHGRMEREDAIGWGGVGTWESGWEKQKSLIALFAWPSYYFTLCFSVARLLSTTTTCPLLMSRARMIEC